MHISHALSLPLNPFHHLPLLLVHFQVRRWPTRSPKLILPLGIPLFPLMKHSVLSRPIFERVCSGKDRVRQRQGRQRWRRAFLHRMRAKVGRFFNIVQDGIPSSVIGPSALFDLWEAQRLFVLGAIIAVEQ